MALALKGNTKIPQYLRLADELRRQIVSGRLQPGDQLPTYAEARRHYGINAYTMERAQALLEQEGLISRERGRGAFVAPPRQAARTGIIGCSGMDFASSQYSPYWASIMEGVETAAHAADMRILLLSRHSTAGWDQVDGVLINAMSLTLPEHGLPRQVPCVSLLAPLWPEAVYRKALERQNRATGGLPPISLAPAAEARKLATISSVASDEYDGMCQAVRHLLELGHRRIAYLSNSNSDPVVYPQRFAAYRDALRQYGIEIEPAWVRRIPSPSPEVYFMAAGRSSMQRWLSEDWRQQGCTALLANNDETAWGAVEALHEAGLRVPEDVSVLGYDGTLAAQWCRPPLTSVAVPLAEIGRTAMEILLREIRGEVRAVEHRVLPVELRLGASTAPPR